MCERRHPPMCQRLHREDPARIAERRDLDLQQPDGPTADDGDPVARTHRAQEVRMEADEQRLDERHLLVGDDVRDREQQLRRPCHQLPQAPIEVALARESARRTEVGPAREAVAATAAGDARLDGHAFPTTRAGRDGATHLVAGDDGPAESDGADATLQEPVQVRATETHRIDADEGFTRAGDRLRLRGDAQVPGAVQPRGSHDQAPGELAPGRVARRVSTARWMSAAAPAAATAARTSWTMATE